MGGLGFDMKWNLGWIHDTLEFFGREPTRRSNHSEQLTFALLNSFNESYMLPFSHDEVANGKGSMLARMPGDTCHQFANMRLNRFAVAEPQALLHELWFS